MLAAVIPAVERHRNLEGVDANAYRLNRRALLATTAKQRTRIYLDTNYWLYLRDSRMGRSRAPSHRRLASLLYRLAANQAIVVPATDTILDEIQRQSDKRTRFATAEIVDDLCQGFALVGFNHRCGYEMNYWLQRSVAVIEGVLHPSMGVWTFPAYLFGPLHPTATAPPGVMDVFRRVMEDIMPSIRFRDMVTTLREFPEDMDQPRRTASKLNRLFGGEGGDFLELYREEALGYWRSNWKLIEKVDDDALARLDDGWADAEGAWDQGRVLTHVDQQIESRSIGEYLPSMQVIAGGHAAIRASESRQHKKGDFPDLKHAAAAIAYCSAIFTDSSMKHLLTAPPLALNKRFPCTIIGSVDEAIAFLEGLRE